MMDALQAYHSSDSEGESESRFEVIPPRKKRKSVDVTPVLPKPDLEFDFCRHDFQKRPSEGAVSHSLLPWSKPQKREQYLEKKTGRRNAGKVGLGVASVHKDYVHMVPVDQLPSNKTTNDLDHQETVSGCDSHRLQPSISRDHHFMHPHRFGPESSAWAHDDPRVAHASSIGSSSQARDQPSLRNSGSRGPTGGTTKRAFVIQPYMPKRLRQAPNQSSGAHLSDTLSESPPSQSMYSTHPAIAHQMEWRPTSKLPRCRKLGVQAHSGPVTHIRWCLAQFSHLLLSASMDKTVRIWNGIGKGGHCLQTLSCHRGAVKDAQWVAGGYSVLSCAFDKTARLCDVESGKELQVFDHPSYATCIKTKPDDPNVFICGTHNSSIFCWDIRTGNTEHEYRGKLGQILDVEFLPGCEEFAMSCDVVSRDSADRTIMVWDLRTTAVVSNQLYHEKYTCPCLRAHPNDSVFVAQSTSNYIALFSTVRPYKLNKFKRYEGHQLEGHHIGCDFSPDGGHLVSGSSEGKVYVYDYRTTRLLKTLQCFQAPCTDVACHPVLPGVVAACSWDGNMHVWQ